MTFAKDSTLRPLAPGINTTPQSSAIPVRTYYCKITPFLQITVPLGYVEGSIILQDCWAVNHK